MDDLEALRFHAASGKFKNGHPLDGILQAAVDEIDVLKLKIKNLELEISLLEGDEKEFG